jgi:alpha/beta superfamily hydrolase
MAIAWYGQLAAFQRGEFSSMTIGALAFTAASTYAVSTSVFWAAQRRLVFGRPKALRTLQPGPLAGQFAASRMWLDINPRVRLEGWVARPQTREPGRVLLYFGGRNEHVGWAPSMASYLDHWTIYAFNYRGFGGSTGRASESRVKSDACRIMEEIHRIENLDASALLLMGRSLGTAIAISAARASNATDLVLLSPFDSVGALLQRRPMLKSMRWALNQQFNCMEDAAHVQANSVIVLADHEARIPHANSMNLAAALPALKQVIRVVGTNHKTLPRHPQTQACLASILNRQIQH